MSATRISTWPILGVTLVALSIFSLLQVRADDGVVSGKFLVHKNMNRADIQAEVAKEKERGWRLVAAVPERVGGGFDLIFSR